MLKHKLKFGEKFCVLPFIHFHAKVSKQQLVCCDSIEPIDENKLIHIRNDLLDNKPVTACALCYRCEEQKLISPRQRAIKNFLSHEDKVLFAIDSHKNGNKIIPISYDLRYSNLCNLECQTCNAEASSSIALRQGIKNDFLNSALNIDINEDATDIYLAGGEPFLIKSFGTVLRGLTNKECEIVINTNATILTEHLMAELDKFTNISFIISIDGVGLLNDKIRKNSQWSDIVANIDILAKRYGGYHIFLVNTVVQKDNINQLLELGEWIESKNINKWRLSLLELPEKHHYSHNTFIEIPDALMKLSIIKTNIENTKALKTIKQYAEN